MSFQRRLKTTIDDWGRDGVLLLICFIVFVILAKLTIDDRYLFGDGSSIGNQNQKIIASIEMSQNTVMVKPNDLPVWSSVDSSDSRGTLELGTQDQVFTDKNSRAELKFKKGGSIFLEENSLVVIDDSSGESDLKLEKGFVTGSSDSAKPLKITAGKIKVELSDSAKVRVSVGENNTTQIQAISGKAQFVSEGKVITIEENQVAAVSAQGAVGEIKKLKIKLLDPKDSEEIAFINRFSGKFKWSKEEDVKSVILSIAKDQSFKSVVYTTETKGTEVEVSGLAGGAYFWRVVPAADAKKEKDLYAVQYLKVVEIFPPVLLKPANHEPIELVEPSLAESKERATEFAITLHWQIKGESRTFEVTLAKDDAFKQPVLSKQVEGLNTMITLQDEGRYFWRVRQARSDASESPWSSTWEFDLRLLKLPNAPRINSPGINDVIAVSEKNKEIQFKLEPISEAKLYQVEVSSDKVFKSDGVTKLESIKSQIGWMPLSAGDYYARARLTDRHDRATAYSEVVEFKVKPAPPELEQAGKILVNLLKDKQVRLSWRPSYLANAYTVEIAKNTEFADKVYTETMESSQVLWAPPVEGKYFWRVRALSANQVESDFSVVRSFEAKAPAPPLVPKVPKKMKLWIESQSDVDVGGFDESTRKVANNQSWRAKFGWDKVPGAVQYHLEISKTEDFKAKLFNVLLKDPEFSWNGVQPGVYYFRVASVDEYGQISGFSDPGVIEVNFPAPIIERKLNFETLETFQAEVLLSWTLQPDTGAVDLEIARDATFDQVVQSEQVADKSLSIKLNSGEYFWHVRRIHAADNKGPWSEVGQITVSLKPKASADQALKYSARDYFDFPNYVYLGASFSQARDSIDSQSFSGTLTGGRTNAYYIEYLRVLSDRWILNVGFSSQNFVALTPDLTDTTQTISQSVQLYQEWVNARYFRMLSKGYWLYGKLGLGATDLLSFNVVGNTLTPAVSQAKNLNAGIGISRKIDEKLMFEGSLTEQLAVLNASGQQWTNLKAELSAFYRIFDPNYYLMTSYEFHSYSHSHDDSSGGIVKIQGTKHYIQIGIGKGF
jgi:hypothetical protein